MSMFSSKSLCTHKIQNKINKIANKGKLNDLDNSLIWADGMLKDKIIDIKMI